MNDQPAQIPKLITTGVVPRTIANLERCLPKISGYFNTLLKFALALKVHDQGRALLESSHLIEVMFASPLQPGFMDCFANTERTGEYNRLFTDLFSDAEPL